MKKKAIRFSGMCFVLLLLAVFCGPLHAQAASPSVSVTGRVSYKESYQFLNKLNKLRKAKGLPKVQMDKTLLKQAEKRAAELTIRFSHKRPNGRMPNSLSKKINAENIAYNFDADGVFEGWKNSPPHYKNMTNRNLRSVGICSFEYQGCTYWVNLFGIDRADRVSRKKDRQKTIKTTISSKYLTASRIGLANGRMLSPGDKFTMRITLQCSRSESGGILPNSFFSFKSSNPSVAKVNQKGTITARKEGKAKITVQCRKYKKLKKTFTVRVEEDSDGFDYIDYSDD